MMKRWFAFLLALVLMLGCTPALGATGDVIRIYDEDKVREYVTHCYQTVLNREPDNGGLELWVAQIMDGISDPVDAGVGFTGSDEFRNRYLNESDYIRVMYQLFLYRNPTESDVAGWVKRIYAQNSREAVGREIGNSPESQGHIAEMCSVSTEETQIGVRKLAGGKSKQLKKGVTPKSLFENQDTKGMLGGILYTEVKMFTADGAATRGFSTLDLFSQLPAYEGLDSLGRGYGFFPMLGGETYYIAIWDEKNLQTWGTVPVSAVEHLLPRLTQYTEVDINNFYGVVLSLEEAL